MRKGLLYAAGGLNLLFGLFHILVGYRLQTSPAIPAYYRGFMEACNAAVTLMIFFLASACLFCQRDMLETRLGKAVLVLGSALYLARAFEEFFWFSFAVLVFASCLVPGAIHLAVLLWPSSGAAQRGPQPPFEAAS